MFNPYFPRNDNDDTISCLHNIESHDRLAGFIGILPENLKYELASLGYIITASTLTTIQHYCINNTIRILRLWHTNRNARG